MYKFIKITFENKFYNNEPNSLLNELIDSTIGGDWGKDSPQDNYISEVYCVRGADLPYMEYGSLGKSPVRYILEKNKNNKELSDGNIIVEISGGSPTQSTGRTAYITKQILDSYDKPLLCTNFCRAVKTKNKIYSPYVYMIFKIAYEKGLFFNYENGTTGIKNLNLNSILDYMEIYIASEEEVKDFYNFFTTIFNKISQNSKENEYLEQLRDTLLPKLINGEIDLDKIEI